MRGLGSIESEWEANTAKWGQPVWKVGYWFWDQASIISYMACVPFGERSGACVAWNANNIIPSVTVPPFLKDMSVVGVPSENQINGVRAAVFLPMSVSEGIALDTGSGPLSGKTYWSALKVVEKRWVTNYELSRLVAAIIGTAEANKIEAIDPAATNLINIASLTDLTSVLNPETKEGEELPFWKSPVIVMSAVGFVFLVMAKKRRKRK
jgi:hypothetical protein